MQKPLSWPSLISRQYHIQAYWINTADLRLSAFICGKYIIDCYAADYNSDGNPYKMNRIKSELT